VRETSASSAFDAPHGKSAKPTSKRRVIDPDNPALTPDQLKRLRPISKDTLDFIDRARGRPPSENPKKAVSLRLDQDVIEHYKRQGAGWQSRMNEALRKQAKLKG
jgi:uncharacterized protein (DUF4415 family)